MSIEAGIFATLKGLVSNRCYPLTAPDGTTGDYLTYQQISGVRQNTLTGDSILRNCRFQIDGYSATYMGAKALRDAVKEAFKASTISANGQAPILLSDNDLPFDGEGKIYRVSMDYSIWIYD